MEATTSTTTTTTETIPQPIEISFPLPKAPHAILHCQLTFLEACSMIHLTTTEIGQSGSSITPMGSLVYAIPDVSCPYTAYYLHQLALFPRLHIFQKSVPP